jgi:hypothetical protein
MIEDDISYDLAERVVILPSSEEMIMVILCPLKCSFRNFIIPLTICVGNI